MKIVEMKTSTYVFHWFAVGQKQKAGKNGGFYFIPCALNGTDHNIGPFLEVVKNNRMSSR